MLKKGKKYIGLFLIREQETYTLLGKKRFKPSTTLIKFKGKPYIFAIDKPAYSKGLKLFYLFDINLKQQLHFIGEEGITIDPEVIDLFVNKNIIRQFLAGLFRSAQVNIMNIIMGLAVGGLIGFIAGSML